MLARAASTESPPGAALLHPHTDVTYFRNKLFGIDMKLWQRTLVLVLVLSTCIGCDQMSKDLVIENLRFGPAVTLWSNTVHLLYAENPGAAFSLGANLSPALRFWFFTVGSGVFLAGLLLFIILRNHATHLEVLGFALVLGGGFSNLLDRILKDGRVIDFVMIELGEVRSAIFNFADVMIIMGIVVLVYELWRIRWIERTAWQQ